MIRGLWRAGGSFLTVALLGWGVANVVAQISFDTRSFTRVVTTPVRAIDARVGSGSIDVVAVPGSSRVVVRGEIERGLIDTRATFALRGDRIEIRSSCAPVLNQNCKARYHLQVPPAVRILAHAEGHIRVTGTSGALEARASDGSITLTNVTGPVDAHASQGTVRATGLGRGRVRASAGQGDVDLAFARDPDRVDVHAGEGDIDIVVPADGVAYRVDATTSEGSTKVRVPTDQTSPRVLTAHAGQGDVTVEPGS